MQQINSESSFGYKVARSWNITVRCLASVADNENANRRNKHQITRVFSAEKLNGNSAKQLL